MWKEEDQGWKLQPSYGESESLNDWSSSQWSRWNGNKSSSTDWKQQWIEKDNHWNQEGSDWNVSSQFRESRDSIAQSSGDRPIDRRTEKQNVPSEAAWKGWKKNLDVRVQDISHKWRDKKELERILDAQKQEIAAQKASVDKQKAELFAQSTALIHSNLQANFFNLHSSQAASSFDMLNGQYHWFQTQVNLLHGYGPGLLAKPEHIPEAPRSPEVDPELHLETEETSDLEKASLKQGLVADEDPHSDQHSEINLEAGGLTGATLLEGSDPDLQLAANSDQEKVSSVIPQELSSNQMPANDSESEPSSIPSWSHQDESASACSLTQAVENASENASNRPSLSCFQRILRRLKQFLNPAPVKTGTGKQHLKKHINTGRDDSDAIEIENSTKKFQ